MTALLEFKPDPSLLRSNELRGIQPFGLMIGVQSSSPGIDFLLLEMLFSEILDFKLVDGIADRRTLLRGFQGTLERASSLRSR